MKIDLSRRADALPPRTTCVISIRDRAQNVLGWSSRCDCGSREDHLHSIDGIIMAREKAERHALTHRCRRGTTPWSGHLAR